jgi:hypothetical protein
MLFSIDDLLDEAACYRLLLTALHPEGLHCPKRHALPPDQAPHDRHREPVVDYRCRTCGKVFNVFTGTPPDTTSRKLAILITSCPLSTLWRTEGAERAREMTGEH